jgi:hypothetical protein
LLLFGLISVFAFTCVDPALVRTLHAAPAQRAVPMRCAVPAHSAALERCAAPVQDARLPENALPPSYAPHQWCGLQARDA